MSRLNLALHTSGGSNTTTSNANAAAEAEVARLASELSVRASDLDQTRAALAGLKSEEAVHRLKTIRTEERLDKLKEEVYIFVFNMYI